MALSTLRSVEATNTDRDESFYLQQNFIWHLLAGNIYSNTCSHQIKVKSRGSLSSSNFYSLLLVENWMVQMNPLGLICILAQVTLENIHIQKSRNCSNMRRIVKVFISSEHFHILFHYSHKCWCVSFGFNVIGVVESENDCFCFVFFHKWKGVVYMLYLPPFALMSINIIHCHQVPSYIY